jgi:hypothetical protein
MKKDEKTVEETKKETTNVNAMEFLQSNIENQIKKFNLLQEKLNHRDKFLRTKDKLALVDKSISDNELNNDFVTDQITIVLSGKINGYREDEVLKISVVPMIRDFITFISERIDIKVQELEKEIIEAN